MMTPTALDEILGKATSITLTDNDVVFGRGGFTNKHPANIEYLKLLRDHEEAYMDCKRKYQKLLSLCIIHQLRCKGVRFLKKDEKTGHWKTVQLSQCRLKISQRLRERAPFIKLEQMKASRSIIQATRPVAGLSTAPSRKRSFSHSAPRPQPVEIIAVTDHSSDEEDGFDDSSTFSSSDSISLRSAIESLLGDCDQQQQEQEEDSIEFPMFDMEYPRCKRPRTVSMDQHQDSYADMLLKEAILLDDISIANCDDLDEGLDDFQLDSTTSFASNFDTCEVDMLDYLQVLF